MPNRVEYGAGKPMAVMINMDVFGYFSEVLPYFPVDSLIANQQPMSLSPGTRFGHYDVTALLGEGGSSALALSVPARVSAHSGVGKQSRELP